MRLLARPEKGGLLRRPSTFPFHEGVVAIRLIRERGPAPRHRCEDVGALDGDVGFHA